MPTRATACSLNKEGTTRITATVLYGKARKTATLNLKVYDSYKPTKVTIDTPKRTVLRATTPKLSKYLGLNNTINFGSQYTIEAVEPVPALYVPTFASSNKKVGEINPKTGIFTIKGKGTTKVTVSAKYTNYGATTTKKATWTVTVKEVDGDLTKLFGKYLQDLNAYIGITGNRTTFDKDELYYWYFDGDASVQAAFVSGKMKILVLAEDTPYNFFGIEYGAPEAEAEAILKKKGFTLAEKTSYVTMYAKGKTAFLYSTIIGSGQIESMIYGDAAMIQQMYADMTA